MRECWDESRPVLYVRDSEFAVVRHLNTVNALRLRALASNLAREIKELLPLVAAHVEGCVAAIVGPRLAGENGPNPQQTLPGRHRTQKRRNQRARARLGLPAQLAPAAAAAQPSGVSPMEVQQAASQLARTASAKLQALQRRQQPAARVRQVRRVANEQLPLRG